MTPKWLIFYIDEDGDPCISGTHFFLLIIALIILSPYAVNLGTYQTTGYVVKTSYETFPLERTYITLCYGHPDTVSHAEFITFSVHGYHEFELNKQYRITTHATITQILKHLVSAEVLEGV